MALNAAHWTISVATEGEIRYIGPAHGVASASYVTTIELHRWLGDLADDASASGDDTLDITDTTPSERNGTDNNITLYPPYNIDQIASEHIFDGFEKGKADAALAASIFHYGEYSVTEVKSYLKGKGTPVRL